MFFRTLVLIVSATLVTSQATDAVCTSGWSWASNSRGQNPCLVYAYVRAVCEPGFVVYALPGPDYYYRGPLKNSPEDNSCMCSTVAFSLMSACGLCQNGEALLWSAWSTNCSMLYLQIFVRDIPSGTSIPAWAYLNVQSADLFDPYQAQHDLGLPESSATSFKPTGTMPPPATPTNPYPKKKPNIAPIIGGVIGGLFGLGLIIAFLMTMICFIRRRRRYTAQSTPAIEYPNSQPTPPTVQYAPSQISHVPSMSQQRHYDPSDPSTFPATPITTNSVHTIMLDYTRQNAQPLG